jgi:hypothetical protein
MTERTEIIDGADHFFEGRLNEWERLSQSLLPRLILASRSPLAPIILDRRPSV